jgi:branched-chain amino acid transport system permease protein
LGRTFQVARPFLRMTVHDNVLVGALVSHPTAAEAERACLDALQRVGLHEKVEEVAGTLNNLELRLMELARALASRPTVLLLDETLAGLGFQDIDPILNVIRRIPRDGTTVIIIEHTMHAMMRLVDELVVLDQGRIIASGEPRRVIADPRVIEAYLGRKWMAHSA